MFLSRSTLPLCVAAVLIVAPATSQVDEMRRLERERIEALVAAGALPRNALADHERGWKQKELDEQFAELFAQDELSRLDADKLVDIARELNDLAQQALRITRERVEAGVLPPKELAPLLEAAEWAAKRQEMADRRATLVAQLEVLASAEARWSELEDEDLAFEFEGEGVFYDADLAIIEQSFWEETGQPLPISAMGRTAVHAEMGLDHVGRVDVAVHPDSAEGEYLIDLLEYLGLPYLAFRSAVPGAATGPHIHIGPPSEALRDPLPDGREELFEDSIDGSQ